MADPPNLLRGIPAQLPDELVRALLDAPGVRVERIVCRGHTSPDDFWYEQDTSEWVLLVSGAARLRLEGDEPVAMTAGSYLSIPAHRRHRVRVRRR